MKRRILVSAIAVFVLNALCGAATQNLSSPHYVFTTQTATGATSDAIHFMNSHPANHSVQLVVTGTPGSCAYRLEGSLNGTNWFDLSNSQDCSTTVLFHVVDRPVDWIRGYLVTLSGGTAPSVTFTYGGGRN